MVWITQLRVRLGAAFVAALLCSCGGHSEADSAAVTRAAPRDQLEREEFNRLAVRRNLPLYWVADMNADRSVDQGEVAPLLFYPPFSGSLDSAYQYLLAAKSEPLPDPASEEGRRRAGVRIDLDRGRATLVASDLSGRSPAEKIFVGHMLSVGEEIDKLYLAQSGSASIAHRVAHDSESRSLFRRNQRAGCLTVADSSCSAIPGAPPRIVDVYPAVLGKLSQSDGAAFCEALQQHPGSKALLAPFTVVRERDSKLYAVPFSQAYAPQMTAISHELNAAADSLGGLDEEALVKYLRAAAQAFLDNDWWPADEAWSKMNAENSKWYVRVGPDEVYWDPCASKGGFHLMFAQVNEGSKQWQQKLTRVQQDMEVAIAQRAGAPYRARPVRFHLPEFIDIVVNAGDDRAPFDSAVGQSLPNVGPVAQQSRGRTVAMVNLYTDADSVASYHEFLRSILDADSVIAYSEERTPGLLTTILHEATHNLGPAQEYAVGTQPLRTLFGGRLDSLFEELKAQTGALFLIDLLRTNGIVSEQLARQTYIQGIGWALSNAGKGMYIEPGHEPSTYPQLAAIQLGILTEEGALSWDPNAVAANGKDRGAYKVHSDKVATACDAMMRRVAGIKARGDRKAAEALVQKYVDGKLLPLELLRERKGRQAKPSLVYAVKL